MKRRKRQARRSAAPPPLQLSWQKKLAFAVVTIPLGLLLLEVCLALVGIQPALYEQDPYVGFSSYVPLFVEAPGPDGTGRYVTASNKLRLFNRQEFPQPKPANTYRIFTVGGSTTYGRPYDDRTSFSGWLREYL